jgi:signal recognition particle subunit SRP54
MEKPLDFNAVQVQLRMMRKLVKMRRIIEIIPGLSMSLPPGVLDQGEFIHKADAIILSMTPWERCNPDGLDGPRKSRMAAGSGTSTQDVSNLVAHLYRMRREA